MKPSVASPIWSWGVLVFSIAFIASSVSLIVSANQQQDEIETNVDLILRLSGVEKSMRDLERQLSRQDLAGAVDYSDARRRLMSSYRTQHDALKSAATSGMRGRSGGRIDSLISEMDRVYAEVLMSEYGLSAMAHNENFGTAVATALEEVSEKSRDAYTRLAGLSVDVAAKWRTITALIVILSLLGIFAAVLHSMHHSADIYVRSEEYFKALFSNASDVITIIGADGSIKYASPSSERILGFKPDDYVTSTTYEHIHDRDVARVHSFIIDALQKPGSIGLIEYRCRHANGGWVDVEATVNNQIDEKNIRGIVISARDVRERRKAQEALHVRDRAVEAARNGIFITDPSQPGNPIIYCNAAFESMTGYKRHEVEGQSASLLFGELTAPYAVKAVEAAFTGQRAGQTALQAYRKNGEVFWTELFISPVMDDNDGLTHFVCVQNDVTDRKLADEERKKFVSLVEHSSDFIGMASLDGRYFYVNEAGREMVGVASIDEVFNREIDYFCMDETKRLIREEAMPAAASEGRWEGEGRLYNTASGTPVDVMINVLLVLHPQTQQPMCYATVQRDITDRNNAIAELVVAKNKAEEMARLKTAFLANMSHEIRTPLTGILGFASVLSEIVSLEQREFVGLIEKSGRRLLDTLNSVLDLARLEADSLELRQERLDVVAEVRETLDVLRPFAQEKQLELMLISTEPMIHAMHDRTCLNRVLQNLLSNAIKFTDEGHVEVRVGLHDDSLRIEVEDTGIGIAPEFVPHIFEEFKQESTGFARSHEGSGLGLAITQRLVTLMGGNIQVTTTKGGGSTFSVTLPVGNLSTKSVTPADKAYEQRALVVTQCKSTFKLISHLLRDHCEVAHEAKADCAVDLLSRHRHAVVLYDLEMPMEAALEVISATRRGALDEATPVVAISPADLLPPSELLHGGFSSFVYKPISKSQLLEAINLVVS